MPSQEEYWNEIYRKAPFKSGKAPSPFLVEMRSKLRKGKILEIGMGEGANAVYLAQQGFTVKGFDLSTVAVEHATQLATDTGVTIEAKRADLDLFLFGLLEYDSVFMHDFKPSVIRYYSEIIRSLKQGGTLLVESATMEEMKEPIGAEDSHKDYYFKTNELLRNLKELRILFYQEDVIDGRHVVRCLAQKPLDRDVAKYALFDMSTGPTQSGPTAQQRLAEELFKKKKD